MFAMHRSVGVSQRRGHAALEAMETPWGLHNADYHARSKRILHPDQQSRAKTRLNTSSPEAIPGMSHNSKAPQKKPVFKLDTPTSKTSTWHRQSYDKDDPAYYVQIATERSDSAYGGIICTKVPRDQVFSQIPNLSKYVLESGHVLLPGTENGIDDEILTNVVQTALRSATDGKGFSMDIEDDPIVCINAHIVLTLLEMTKEAEILLEHMWHLFAQFELKADHVSWIWDNFASTIERRPDAESWPAGPYSAPFGLYYINLAAWQILNLKEEGKLDEIVDKYVYGSELFSEPRLRKLLEKRKKKHGLDKGFDISKLSPEIQGMSKPNAFAKLQNSPGWNLDKKPDAPTYAKYYREPHTPGGVAKSGFDFSRSGSTMSPWKSEEKPSQNLEGSAPRSTGLANPIQFVPATPDSSSNHFVSSSSVPNHATDSNMSGSIFGPSAPTQQAGMFNTPPNQNPTPFPAPNGPFGGASTQPSLNPSFQSTTPTQNNNFSFSPAPSQTFGGASSQSTYTPFQHANHPSGAPTNTSLFGQASPASTTPFYNAAAHGAPQTLSQPNNSPFGDSSNTNLFGSTGGTANTASGGNIFKPTFNGGASIPTPFNPPAAGLANNANAQGPGQTGGGFTFQAGPAENNPFAMQPNQPSNPGGRRKAIPKSRLPGRWGR
ncbi:hypothetical protein K491DRAFT_758033 [Lophiostoma macrostomum CBS 122681]|uniref:Uncharacterized protein n=1 Tax=Lophiostoma macrostomum CBS 122681 TaxID=1314788 RepID=A0A6A6T7R1_9PLEO|nr:hypothetical protein K491DRAFT_758033 [Lophiostoma macrostomum CBS 122681]